MQLIVASTRLDEVPFISCSGVASGAFLTICVISFLVRRGKANRVWASMGVESFVVDFDAVGVSILCG